MKVAPTHETKCPLGLIWFHTLYPENEANYCETLFQCVVAIWQTLRSGMKYLMQQKNYNLQFLICSRYVTALQLNFEFYYGVYHISLIHTLKWMAPSSKSRFIVWGVWGMDGGYSFQAAHLMCNEVIDNAHGASASYLLVPAQQTHFTFRNTLACSILPPITEIGDVTLQGFVDNAPDVGCQIWLCVSFSGFIVCWTTCNYCSLLLLRFNPMRGFGAFLTHSTGHIDSIDFNKLSNK